MREASAAVSFALGFGWWMSRYGATYDRRDRLEGAQTPAVRSHSSAFCERVLAEIDPVIQVRAQSAHQRYLGIFKIIEQRDREMASIFDDPRRSNALGDAGPNFAPKDC